MRIPSINSIKNYIHFSGKKEKHPQIDQSVYIYPPITAEQRLFNDKITSQIEEAKKEIEKRENPWANDPIVQTAKEYKEKKS